MYPTTRNLLSAQDPALYDVVISGAGPVGLFLACELALAHCSVLILEKSSDPHSPLKQIPFGIRGLSAPTIESLDRRGLLQELVIHKSLKNPHTAASPEMRRQAGHFAGIPFYESDIDTSQWIYRLPGSPAPSLISEIQELETILSRRAEALGVRIMRGLPVTGFHETERGVSVASNDHTFDAGWLVGCDGSRSVIRKTGGFEFAGTEPEFTGYTAKLELADPEKLGSGRNFTATGMYLQSQPGYLVIQDFDKGAFHGSDAPITLEHVQQVLRRVSNTNVTIKTLHAVTTWTDRARQATTYRKGRVLLAGDAAHIHAPLGGQGLNLGLGDAMNLGWKLAAAIKGKAPQNLLDSYEAERYPIGMQVLDWSRSQVAIMKPDPSARALNAIFRELIATRDGATYFASRVWGIHTCYNIGNGHPLTGCSVPGFELEDGTRINELLHDGRGILLDFDANEYLKKIAGECDGLIKYIPGSAKDQLGLKSVLIRPDGIVAWASDQQQEEQAVTQSIAHWFKC